MNRLSGMRPETVSNRVLKLSVQINAVFSVLVHRRNMKPRAGRNRPHANGIARTYHAVPNYASVKRAEVKDAPGLVLVVSVVLGDDGIGPLAGLARFVTRPDGHGECPFVNRRRWVDRDEIVDPVEMKRTVCVAETVRRPGGTVEYSVMSVTAGVVRITRK